MAIEKPDIYLPLRISRLSSKPAFGQEAYGGRLFHSPEGENRNWILILAKVALAVEPTELSESTSRERRNLALRPVLETCE